MAYLPSGWTQEQLRSATVDTLHSVPEDRLHELDANVIESLDAKCIVLKAQRYAGERAERQRLGLPPAPPKPIFGEEPSPDPIVEVVERAGLDDFGYLVYRTDYSSEERWEEWLEKFNEIVDASLARCSCGNRIADKLLSSVVDEAEFDHASLGQIAESYSSFLADGNVPPGLGVSMCLLVDSDAMKSLLNVVPGQEPWVYAVDSTFDFSESFHAHSAADGEKYPGFFKVAIDSVVTELYPMLAGAGMHPEELWPMARPIWKSAF